MHRDEAAAPTVAREIPRDLPEEISRRTLYNFPLSMVLADPRREDCPIVYANKAFTETTGYSPEAVVGRNCRFLQGEKTADADRAALREAISEGREVTVDILNYRADGTTFVNRLMVAPLKDDESGQILYFIGVQIERTQPPGHAERAADLDAQLTELQHRVKNHLAMILSLVRLEMRNRRPDEVIDILVRRVESLSLLYDEFVVSDDRRRENRIDLGAYLSRVATAVHGLDGRPTVILNIDCASVTTRFEDAAPVGLLLSELMTNAFRHGFGESRGGSVCVSLQEVEERAGRVRLLVTDDGDGFDPADWPSGESLGGRIARQLIERIDADLSVESDAAGSRIELTFAP